MHIDPLALTPQERYKLLVGAVVPRPIGFVSTRSPEGVDNLAPFSFFNGVSSNPLSLLFCPTTTPGGGDKDTLRNIEQTSQFVVNIVSESIARRMAICAEDYPPDVSEFERSGLTPAVCEKIRPPRVAESPFSFECELIQIVRLEPDDANAPGSGNIVIGRVVWIHAADGVVDERHRVDPARLAAVGRMAGLTYCTTRGRFELPWGEDAVSAPEPDFDSL
ncbi:MAG: flavin reductase family protein [Phycisphaeraceae bacterium]|nr:MAG: flavin reductase family protein [Phycisphaeraceae bacterium]